MKTKSKILEVLSIIEHIHAPAFSFLLVFREDLKSVWIVLYLGEICKYYYFILELFGALKVKFCQLSCWAK